jgi:hypothetical protein
MSIGDTILGVAKGAWNGLWGGVKGAIGKGFGGGLLGAVVGAVAIGCLAAFTFGLGGWALGLAIAAGGISFGAVGATTGAAYGSVTGVIGGVRDGQDGRISEIEEQTRRLQQVNAKKANMIAAAGGFDNDVHGGSAKRIEASRMAPNGMNR